jgi:endonuclease/exonuclease/phosphatase family metal-dependent hydrolase
MSRRRRIVIVLSGIFLLFITYKVLAVWTIQYGECKPKPVDPSLRLLTRDERGRLVSFPERIGYPAQARPLVVMTYNISGHNELYDSHHLQKIATVINAVKPDIVGLQEVHRKTWQTRFNDQVLELQRLTHLNAYFGATFGEAGGGFGNAILTRGTFVYSGVHQLPAIGEPRAVVESLVRIDNILINVYVTHLTTWGKFKRKDRDEELVCLAKHVRTSRYPYLLMGDFNAPPESEEIRHFRQINAAQICGETLAPTHPLMNERIDYVWADYGWEVRAARVLATGPSDHYPVVAELFWNRS